jgi:hypothetical protein
VDPGIGGGNDFKLSMGLLYSLINLNRTSLFDVSAIKESLFWGGE